MAERPPVVGGKSPHEQTESVWSSSLSRRPSCCWLRSAAFSAKPSARDDTYQHLRVFEDVVSLIINNYVERVNIDKVMKGAMHGLADGLDPDSAYLTPAQVKTMRRPTRRPRATSGSS